MKGLMLLVAMGVLFAGFVSAAPEWDDVKVIQVNTEKPHATMMVYPSAKAALKADPEKSPWFESLNGKWKFQWSENPEKRPTEFYQEFFDDSDWDDIPVPSNWQLQGYGVPVYKNMGLAFPKDAPNAPKEFNPVGSYRTEFKISKGWKARKIYLHFDGVDAAFYLWINGQKVGYSQGSRTPAEFDITKYVKPGKNLLAAEVYRFCDGSYLEDQDFWRLSGIFRDVYLFSTAPQHIRDFSVVTDLDKYYRDAELKVVAEVLNPNGSVEMELFDADGKSVVKKAAKATGSVAFSVPVAAPKKWTAETPNLYKLLLTLKDADGKTVEVIPQRVGFRETEIRGESFLVNGEPILLKGVNRHEHNPDMGHVVTRETMMRDIVLFKKYNINAVRTSHYANHPLWFELCDQYGIYVMDEANLETHFAGNNSKNLVANGPEWKEQMVDRMRRMVSRDRNYACVIIWSMGNEAGDGPNFKACIDWIHQADPTRSVHYEGSARSDGTNSDWGSNMYALPGVDGKPGRPYLLCEYTHAMGNSNGNLSEYWDTIYASKRHHGAFVWDWMDQGLRVPVPDGKIDPLGRKDAFAYGRYWANYHGNAYAEKYGNDTGQFCMNGLIAADWTPHPGLEALKHIYRNIHVKPVDLSAGRIRVKNWFDFINAGDIAEGRWAVVSEDRKIAEGNFQPLEIAPRAEREITLPLPAIVPEP
ncbi:MAG: hypothetical protein K9M45_07900, partial [Kiritimatiellales bacterium]|nr:hypothetical protein [Kiritimatiellales bacterium]